MESFLSGYSKGYTGSVGVSYTGGVSGAGSGGVSSNGQNADVSQLKPGDTFQGEITSVNGEDVQIQLTNGLYMAAKLERDVQVALGQVLNLQVQSNKDNKVVLKPVVDGNSQMLRVGEAALRAANMSVNEKNLQLVAKLIENGMPINKNTLMTYNRLALQNPKVPISNIIELNKLKLPITEDNARQLENYRNMEHKIVEGVKDAANELVKTYDSIVNSTAQGTPAHLPAIQNGVRFMENVLSLVAGESAEGDASAGVGNGDVAANKGAGVGNSDVAENRGAAGAENDIKSENNTNIAKNTDNTADVSVKGNIKAENDVNIAKNENNSNIANNVKTENNPAVESNISNGSRAAAKADGNAAVNTDGNMHGENVSKADNVNKELTISDNDMALKNKPENARTDSAQDSMQADNERALTHSSKDAAANVADGLLTGKVAQYSSKDAAIGADGSKMTNEVNASNVANSGITGEQPLKQDARNVSQQASGQASNQASQRASGQAVNQTPQQASNHISQQASNQASQSPRAADAKFMSETVSKEELMEIGNQLRGEMPKNVPERIINYISSGKLDLKALHQLLTDSGIGKKLTPEQKSKIFGSEPFKHLLKAGLGKRWSLAPDDIASKGKVEEFYDKLLKESSRLAKLINEAANSAASTQTAGTAHAKAMGNIAENVEFINQMNQMFNYVQLPLKLGDSHAHGDLYVYTNKKHIARKDGMLTAFLHLDMDNLGPLDVNIALQTEKMQINTKFYLDEDSLKLVGAHMGELVTRLEKKGYRCKSMVLEKNEDKTVLEHIEEQIAAGNAVIGYRTFDTRA